MRLLVPIVVTTLSACGPTETAFPPGIAPLEENLVPPGEAPWPEVVEVVSGEAEEHAWAHGRGAVHAALPRVWQAFQEPDVVVDRREVDEWDVTFATEPDMDFGMVVHQIVRQLVTAEYDVTWRHLVVEGSVEDPELVALRWQKTEGFSLIRILRGSVLLREVAEGVTEIDVIAHLGAPQTDEEMLHAFLVDLHADVVAFVHGEPLPVYGE